jgi:hypothetical protein
MNRVVGSLDMFLGGIFVLLGIIAIGSTPAAWRNVAAEPEDFYGLLLLFVLCIGIGAVAFLVGWVLVRGKVVWKLSPNGASILSGLVGALLLLVAALGFFPDETGSSELRLLLLAAIPLATSCVLLRRSGSAHRGAMRTPP